jgi:hypothetical protein
MGLATAFLASNCVYGQDAFEVGEDEQFEPRETETVKANGQKGKFFVIDVKAARNALPAYALSRVKEAYPDRGGLRDSDYHGWVQHA